MDENVVRWLVCGASAGFAVDLGLYPLDTLKTRLQSKQGFVTAGGFKNVYKGMSSVAIGSAPGGAIFFLAYRSMNRAIGKDTALVHAVSASFAEVCACLIRVPTELIKQRSQAGSTKPIEAARSILSSTGPMGLYRGYFSTVCREIPFALIEYPLWEALKKAVAKRKGPSAECSPLEGAACGSVAGSFAAAVTTPLDVAKTRIMLSTASPAPGIGETLRMAVSEGGVAALFSGVVPRVMWMAIGGFVFFGAYETVNAVSQWIVPEKKDK